MVKVWFGVSIGVALGARVQTHLQNDAGLVEYIVQNLGRSHDEGKRVAGFINQHWPLAENTDDHRRMKASQLLQMEDHAQRQIQMKPNVTEHACKPLDKLVCKPHVDFAFTKGKWDSSAGDTFYDLYSLTGQSLTKATKEDFQVFFFCIAGLDNRCEAPPCSCTKPPCNTCESKVDFYKPDEGASERCHAHTYCVGKSGDCCPNLNGDMDACCDYKPEGTQMIREPIAEHTALVPGHELEKTLEGGHYLGPLRETRCRNGRSLGQKKDKMLHQCPHECENVKGCKVFSYFERTCELFESCNPAASSDGRMVFVKNEPKMTPTWLPNRTVSGGDSHHFFVIGDWGGMSCDNRESLHYVFKGIKNTSAEWARDHEAQPTVAKLMGSLGENVKPFLVVNAGDNFYWGGVLPRMMGGRGIHDVISWKQGFEDVYTSPSLKVPWLSILGNHDYGGDGCSGDVRAQFDYTVKDMMDGGNNRWKMPGAFYNHRVDFDGFSVEYFMLDTNLEDAFVGRHGGICQQKLCWQAFDRENVPFKACSDWFKNMWNVQMKWYKKTLQASTADWKILVMHHKPVGEIAAKIHPLAVEHGVQLLIGSHTHELAFFEKWYTAKKPLLVVGAGGGAQANPGCGGAIYCSKPHEYGFADVEINQKQMTVSLYRDDNKVVMSRKICRDGSVAKETADC